MIAALARGLLYSTLSNTPQQIAERALAATVFLEMKDGNGAILSRGSGFFVRHDLIATSYHVIKETVQGTAKLVGQETKYTIEDITATDKTNDLALLKVTVQSLTPLPLGNSDRVQIGDTVYVVGNPEGFEGTFSNGIISNIREGHTKKDFLMTAPISAGSSGGPVLNNKGEVIGVSVRIYRGQGAQNINFASHSNALKRLLAHPLVGSLSRRRRAIPIRIYLLRGSRKEKLGDYEGAIADYTKAIRLKPDDDIAYYNRGNAKIKLKQYESAINDHNIAVRLNPNNAYAYYSRGIAKGRLAQYVAAVADYDVTIRLKPDFVNAYIDRGNAKVRLGQLSAAIADFDMAIYFEPRSANAYHNRGIANGILGQYREADLDLRSAWSLADRHGDESLRVNIERVLQIIDGLD